MSTTNRCIPDGTDVVRVPGRPVFLASLARALALVLTALLILPISEGTQFAEAGRRSRTVTRTISSSAPITIPGAGADGPADLYPATIEVKAFKKSKKFKKPRIKDVNLTLHNFSHTYTGNIDIMLVHSDRQATLMSDVSGNNVSVDLTLTLDDEAAGGLPGAYALASGSYRPSNRSFGMPADPVDPFPAPAPPQDLDSYLLSAFDGANPNGAWQLFVVDDTTGDVGSIAGGWSLEITAKVKEEKGKRNKK